MSQVKYSGLQKKENACKNNVLLYFLWYNGITFEKFGVMRMSIMAGILVCAFVYVIRESLSAPGEEEYEG